MDEVMGTCARCGKPVYFGEGHIWDTDGIYTHLPVCGEQVESLPSDKLEPLNPAINISTPQK